MAGVLPNSETGATSGRTGDTKLRALIAHRLGTVNGKGTLVQVIYVVVDQRLAYERTRTGFAVRNRWTANGGAITGRGATTASVRDKANRTDGSVAMGLYRIAYRVPGRRPVWCEQWPTRVDTKACRPSCSKVGDEHMLPLCKM